MIDKSYYRVNLGIYFLDLSISMALFAGSFIACLNTSGLFAVLFYLVSIFSLYRAAAFIHEATHQEKNPRFKIFSLVWNLTVGAITLVPNVRFFKPHNIHHTTGIFRTRMDPQYLLVRSDTKLALFVFVLIPFIMPLLSLFFTLTSALGGLLDAEGALERFLQRKGYSAGSGSDFSQDYRVQVMWLSRYYLALYGVYTFFFPETLILIYAVHVGAWFLGTMRIPLEHRMDYYAETSDERDQVRDSFTVENPIAGLLQPLGLRLHTAHHMYPGVPYHNLPALHRELKDSHEEYRKSIVSFFDALRGPGWGLPSEKPVPMK